MKRKILVMFLIMALLACMLPATALAAPGRYHKPWGGREYPSGALPLPAETASPEGFSMEAGEDSFPGSRRPGNEPDPFRTDTPFDEYAPDPYYVSEYDPDGEPGAPVDGGYDRQAPAEESVPDPNLAPDAGADSEEEAFWKDFYEDSPTVPEQTEEEISAAAALAELIEPDLPDAPVIPTDEQLLADAEMMAAADTLTVSADETVYAYEGMTVFNNGGTVYSNLALVYNNGGLVYSNGGTVYNNGGIVYANGGDVYANAGTVYSNSASVSSFGGNVQESSVYGYHELRFADFYEPYVMISGLDVMPGSEGSIITEDGVCTIAPCPGFLLVGAESDAGTLTWEEDGSLTLSGVDRDVLLALTLQAEAPYFNLISGRYDGPQTVEITAPEGCEIWYTTDGNMPSVGNAVYYDGPFEVSEDCMLIAVAAAAGVESSDPVAVSLRFPTAE